MSAHGDNWTKEQRASYHKRYRKSNPRSKEESSRQNYLYYRRHPARLNEKKERNRLEVIRLKMKPCMDCGVQYNPWVMHFDHRDPREKNFMLSQPALRSLETIRDEALKCDVVCANCHSERTHKQIENGVIKFQITRKIGIYEKTLMGRI